MLELSAVLRRVVSVAAVGVLATAAAQAQSLPDDFDGVFWGSLVARGPGPGPGGPGDPVPPGRGGGPPWPHPEFGAADGGMPMPPMLRGLALTDAQQDKVFAILHDQAPILREQSRVAAHARDDLRALATSARYDAATARALADSGARALAEIALLRADGEHRIFLALTDEQREQLGAMRQMGRPR